MGTILVDDLRLVDTSKLGMPFYTIYDHPKDFPDKYVTRLWDVMPRRSGAPEPTAIASVFDTLEEARGAIPRGLYCLPRNIKDDPVIVESWV